MRSVLVWGVVVLGCEPSVPPAFNSSNGSSLSSLELRPAELTVGVDATATLEVFGVWSDGSEKNLTAEATFWSSNETIASLRNDPDRRGTVIGRREGTAQVFAQVGRASVAGAITVRPARPLRLVVTPTAAQVPLGQLAAFDVAVELEDRTWTVPEGAEWQLVDVTIARREPAGFVAVRPGSTKLSVSWHGLAAEATLDVLAPTVSHLRVDLSKPIVQRGERARLTAYAVMTDGSTREVSAETQWSSSSPAVAQVSASGEVLGRLPGASVLSGAWKGVSGTNLVTVLGERPTFLELFPLTPVMGLGNTRQLFALAWFADGSSEDFSDQVIWSSLDPSIASFSNSAPGLLTAHAAGEVRLAVDLAGLGASTMVTVVAGTVNSLELAGPLSMGAGTTVPFAVFARFSSGQRVEVTAHATWSSSNPSMATVTNSAASRGLVTALTPGSTIVRASWAGRTISAQLVVVP